MGGQMNELITRYDQVRKKMADLLSNESDPPHETIVALDKQLKDSFEEILQADPANCDEYLERIDFLIQMVNEASDCNSLIKTMTDSIFADAQDIVSKTKTYSAELKKISG